MRNILLGVLCLFIFSACASKSPVIKPVATEKRPGIAAAKNKWLAKPMFGAFLSKPDGNTFEPVIALDPRDAIIYIYRPETRWGNQEVQAPAFFIDETYVFGLKSGTYSWIEAPAGEYTLSARRSLGGVNLKHIFELPIQVDGGQSYFIRYSETKPLNLGIIAQRGEYYEDVESAQYVPPRIGKYDITGTRIETTGVFFGEYSSERWAAFESFGETGKGVTRKDDEVYDSEAVKDLSIFGKVWARIKRLF